MLTVSGLVDWLDTRVLYAGRIVKRTEIRATIEHLKMLRERRRHMKAEGFIPEVLMDPAWLVDMAINRKAGWPEDPSTIRGSAMPLPDGRYPPRADGDAHYRAAKNLARMVNEPRLIVRVHELTVLPARLRNKLMHRVTTDDMM